MIETAKMLVLSTAHLKDVTCNTWMPTYDRTAWSKGDYGWFVYVPDGWEDMPEDIVACFEAATTEGCRWIMFDRDGPVLDELPTYDW